MTNSMSPRAWSSRKSAVSPLSVSPSSLSRPDQLQRPPDGAVRLPGARRPIEDHVPRITRHRRGFDDRWLWWRGRRAFDQQTIEFLFERLEERPLPASPFLDHPSCRVIPADADLMREVFAVDLVLPRPEAVPFEDGANAEHGAFALVRQDAVTGLDPPEGPGLADALVVAGLLGAFLEVLVGGFREVA